MKKLFFRATLDYNDYIEHSISGTDPLVLFRYPLEWRPIVREWLRATVDANNNRIAAGKQPCFLEITVQPRLQDRTVKMNNLMWKIYEIQTTILNREQKKVQGPITSQELYDLDMQDYAPIHCKTCHESEADAVKAYAESGEPEYRGHFIGEVPQTNGLTALQFRETSSFWDIKKMSDFLDQKIDELETMGRDRWNDGEVRALIEDFQAHKNNNKKE